MKNLRRAVLGVLFVASLVTSLAWADSDPPGRVARLQYMTGSVSIQPRGTEDWVAGSVNRPLTTSDNVWTDKSSRAELNVGGGVLRMNDETSVTLSNVSDNIIQIQVHQGIVNLRVRKLYSGETYEVDTPNLAFTIQKAGEYRFDVNSDGDATVVTVRKGEGDATGDGPSVHVRAGEQARFSNGTTLAHQIADASSFDGFDDWCRVRFRREDRSVSARYVGSGVIGYEDLDDYGYWETAPSYGNVWYPRTVYAGWAPYRYGHWVYVWPWGWTWVDDSPWGFAPFHYGRWVYYRNRWGWAPGPIYYRPVYAPALVTWFGGPGWGVSFGFGPGGGYGWCPLGWGEPYYPWYGVSRGYFRNVNVTNTHITNITHITNVYYTSPPNRFGHPNTQFANMRAPGGITAVPRGTLERGMPVARTNVPVTRTQIAGAPMGGVRDVTPNRNNFGGEQTGRIAPTPRSEIANRGVMTRLAPPTGPNRESGLSGEGNRSMPSRSNEPASHSLPPTTASQDASASSPVARRVPRPPIAGTTPARGNPGMTQFSNNREGGSPEIRSSVPHPPSSGVTQRNGAQGGHNVPRPPSNPEIRRTSENGPGITVQHDGGGDRLVTSTGSQGGRSNHVDSGSGSTERHAVPRPTGPVLPASSDRGAVRSSAAGSEGGRGYSEGRNYGDQRSAQPRSEGPRYESPRNEGPRSMGPSGSYGGGGGSRSSGPSGSYGGGGGSVGRSAPSGGGGASAGGGRSGGSPSRGSGPHMGHR